MQTATITNKELEAIREIRNFIMHAGRIPSMRELMSSLGYRSPRSASLIVNKLIEKGVLRRKDDGSLQFIKSIGDETVRAQTIDVPLVGIVACGAPMLAEENIQAKIPVSTKLACPPYRYFLLKAKGDSMNQKGIGDGDFVLVRQQVKAQNGDTVVALIDNEVTVKEFHSAGDTVVLKPRSKNKKHQPIVLTRDFQIQGVVVATIPNM
jgi:repressor LexA